MTEELQMTEAIHLPGYGASCKFGYASMPAEIADQIRAAADRVRKLQRGALIDIGRALLAVKHHIGDQQFELGLIAAKRRGRCVDETPRVCPSDIHA